MSPFRWCDGRRPWGRLRVVARIARSGGRHAPARGREDGFTLIELLVVILIIGILAAIAIPSFLNQKGKANDAAAKSLARAGETAAETYAADHAGSYVGVEPKALHELEPAIQIEAGGSNNAYLGSAEAQEGGAGYSVTATATDGDAFTITRNNTGEVQRTCKAAAGVSGCRGGTW